MENSLSQYARELNSKNVEIDHHNYITACKERLSLKALRAQNRNDLNRNSSMNCVVQDQHL